jgi:hypothetical protein
MGTLLLQHPLVQFYLLYLGALWVVLIWKSLRNPLGSRGSAQAPLNEAAQGGSSPSAPLARTLTWVEAGERIPKESQKLG